MNFVKQYKWYILAAVAVGGGVWYWRKRRAALPSQAGW